ncbi:MAG: hypothetical protein Q9187_009487, partial [Circinaria calcarea]
NGHPGIHLGSAQLTGILGRARHNVRVPETEQSRQVSIFGRGTPTRCTARAVKELPEEVGGVRVSVPRSSGADTRVHPDEEADEVRGDFIGEEIGDVGIFTWWSIPRR